MENINEKFVYLNSNDHDVNPTYFIHDMKNMKRPFFMGEK